jgi:O-antigen/teichoic acid export membrane protein
MARAFKKDIKQYLTSTGFVSFIDLLRNILVANILGPKMTGICLSLMSIPQVALYFNFGLVDTTPALVPYLKGNQEKHIINQLKNTIFNLTVFGSISSFLLLIAYAFLYADISSEMKHYIVLASVLVVTGQIRRYLVNDYAAENNILKLSYIEFFSALAIFIFQVPMSYFWGGYGFWTGMIIGTSLLLVYTFMEYARSNSLNFFEIKKEYFKKIFFLGTVMILSAASYLPFIVLSKIFIAFTIGAREVGYFMVSILVITKISILPKAISRVILPRFSFNRGRGESDKIYNEFLKAQIITFLGTGVIVLLGWIFLYPVVSIIMPKYVPGVSAAKIMLLSGLPYCLIDNASNMLIVLSLKKTYLFIFGLVFILLSFFFVILFHIGVTLIFVSTLLGILFLIHAVLLNYSVYKRYKLKMSS